MSTRQPVSPRLRPSLPPFLPLAGPVSSCFEMEQRDGTLTPPSRMLHGPVLSVSTNSRLPERVRFGPRLLYADPDPIRRRTEYDVLQVRSLPPFSGVRQSSPTPPITCPERKPSPRAGIPR